MFVDAEVVLPSTIGWRTQRYLVLFLLVLCDCDFVRGSEFRVAEKSKIRIPRKSKWYYTKNYRSRFPRCWSLLTASGFNTKNFDPTSSRPCEIFTLFTSENSSGLFSLSLSLSLSLSHQCQTVLTCVIGWMKEALWNFLTKTNLTWYIVIDCYCGEGELKTRE